MLLGHAKKKIYDDIRRGLSNIVGQLNDDRTKNVTEVRVRRIVHHSLMEIYEGDVRRVECAMEHLLVTTERVHDALKLDVNFNEDFKP